MKPLKERQKLREQRKSEESDRAEYQRGIRKTLGKAGTAGMDDGADDAGEGTGDSKPKAGTNAAKAAKAAAAAAKEQQAAAATGGDPTAAAAAAQGWKPNA